MAASFLLFLALLSLNFSIAQDSTNNKELYWDIFAETYYSFDFNRPADHQKVSFIYNHNRHNEFNINLALARVGYKAEILRANLGLMMGTYPETNLATEPELLKHIYEASIGLRLSKKKDLWIDGGIFTSHIGFEIPINKENWTLTRSILAENSPYYETGIKGSYSSDNQRWVFSVLVLNGWQRIRRPESNNSISFGAQVLYTPNERFSVNSSSFIGNDKPDSIKKWRYFHDLYSILQFSKNFAITVGFDCGLEQQKTRSSQLNFWYSPVIIMRYNKNNWSIAARAEYYSDKQGVIIPLVNNKPFQMQGYSVNIDRSFGQKAVFRIEGRYFSNPSPYFQRNSDLVTDDFIITTSLLFQLGSTSR